MDIRLKTAKWDLDGQEYVLRCNMAVLADVQEEYGGKFSLALTGTVKSYMVILAAMINDCADERGLGARYTWRQLARHYTRTDELLAVKQTVMPLVVSAVHSDNSPSETDKTEEKND